MKLYRYVLADFRPHLRQSWAGKQTEIDDVSVSIGQKLAEDARRDRRLVTATTSLDGLPSLDANSCIIVPSDKREKCEIAIEHAVNLLSVLESCARSILAPELCVALGAESDEESAFLNSSSGIAINHKSESMASWNIEWKPELAQALSDRMFGVALLSEALSVGGELGAYRDFSRFLELAFGLPFYEKRLAKKLTQFLTQVSLGYSRAEVDEWIGLRHPATHADFKKVKWLAITSDVRPVVFRMQQACLDVLFNKQHWGVPSSERRNAFMPDAVSTSMAGSIVVKQGTALSVRFRVYDECGVYPRDLAVKVDHSKDGLYAKFAGQQAVSNFHIVA